MRKKRPGLQAMSEMNVTNLLDTAFILLMAFMIVAPAIKHGIELELPTVAAQNIDSNKTLTVVIQRSPSAGDDDWVFVEDRRLTIDELQRELVRKKEIFPDIDVMLEADGRVPWASVAEVLAAIKRAGIENLGLITEPETAGE